MAFNGNQLCGWGDPRFPNEQYVGIEIEVENCRYDEMPSLGNWNHVEDGSLREWGREFISEPMPLSNVEAEVLNIYEVLRATGSRGSVRTGIHVHFDIMNYSSDEILAICALYSVLEPALYAMLPTDREENIYCVPWYRADSEAQLLGEAFTAVDAYHARNALTNSCKYTGLNLGSMLAHGTLEFRMAPTFADPADLLKWVDLLNTVIQCGVLLKTPDAVLDMVSTFGLAAIWTESGIDAEALAVEKDGYHCAELLGGGQEVTWEIPMLDYDSHEPLPAGSTGTTKWGGYTSASVYSTPQGTPGLGAFDSSQVQHIAQSLDAEEVDMSRDDGLVDALMATPPPMPRWYTVSETAYARGAAYDAMSLAEPEVVEVQDEAVMSNQDMARIERQMAAILHGNTTTTEES